MNLNHINLPVVDVAASRDFLNKYFGMKTIFELPKNTMAMMRDDAGLILNLSHFGKEAEISYHKDFHVGFFVETRAEVDAIYARMAADGIVAEPPRKLQGRWSFYVLAPGGFLTEVAALEMAEVAK
jgi:catechol 2,3-dioxygenase-like lactoylglutathione lyase family enzyme